MIVVVYKRPQKKKRGNLHEDMQKMLESFRWLHSGKKMSRLRKREGKGIGLRRLSSRVEAILRGMVKVNYGGKMA